jgi:hypothetical protein
MFYFFFFFSFAEKIDRNSTRRKKNFLLNDWHKKRELFQKLRKKNLTFFEKLISLTKCKLQTSVKFWSTKETRKLSNGRPNLQKWGPKRPAAKARGWIRWLRGSAGHRARVFWKGKKIQTIHWWARPQMKWHI